MAGSCECDPMASSFPDSTSGNGLVFFYPCHKAHDPISIPSIIENMAEVGDWPLSSSTASFRLADFELSKGLTRSSAHL